MNFDKFLFHPMNPSKTRMFSNHDVQDSSNLGIFLEYELQASSRYRRYVSVVLLKGVGMRDTASQKQSSRDYSQLRCIVFFRQLYRHSDE